MYCLTLKSIAQSQLSTYKIQIPDEIDAEVENEFRKFQEYSQFEEFDFSENKQLVFDISTNIKNKNWKSTAKTLKKFLKQIRPLDVCELRRLVEKANAAAELIKGKKVIFLMGFTGSGKSTMMHFLAGSKMAKALVDGSYHIIPTEIKNTGLAEVRTSLKMSSETRYITPVTVNYSDVGAYSDGSVILCDSPGFGDTEGAEVDIANGIGMIRAIKGCKSVKPIVLFSFKRIGDKCEGVKELAHLVVGFLPSIKDHVGTFSYTFTKYPDDEKKAIHKTLEQVFNELNEEEKSDIGFVNIMKDMLKKTRKSAHSIDPVNDNPADMLDELADSTAIENPEEVFELSITTKSKFIIQKQLQLDQKIIMSATRRFDCLLVKYKLDNMKLLYNLLHEDYVEQVYNECTRYVTKHLVDEYQNGISAFDHCLRDQTLLTIEDIQRYQTYISHFQIVDEWKENHLGKEVVHSTAFIIHLNQCINNMLSALQETNIDHISVKNNLDKLKLISTFFPDIISQYQQACQSLVDKYKSIIQSFKSSIKANQFTQSANSLITLTHARADLVDHLNFEQSIDFEKYFLDHLNDCVQESEELLNKSKLSKGDIDKLNDCILILDSASKTIAFEPYISLSSVQEILTKIQLDILEYFIRIIKQIDVEETNEDSFGLFEQYMQQLDLIRKIPVIEIKTSESYWQTLEKIIAFVQESRRSVEEQLRILFSRVTKFDHNKLLKSLTNLKDAKWIDKYRSGIHQNILDTVKNELIQHINTAKESLLKIHLELDNFDQIQNVNDLVADINQMKTIEQFIGDINASINAVNLWFEQAMNDVFNVIKNAFNIDKLKEQTNPTIDLNKAEKACAFLAICKSIRLSIKTDYGSILNNFEEFLRYYSDFIQKQMEVSFQIIKQFESQNDTKDIFEQALILNKRLKELIDIQMNYPGVLSYFSNRKLVEQWKQDLTDSLVELTDEIESLALTQQTIPLKNKLTIVKALSRLDGFLDSNVTYLALYKSFQKEFIHQTDSVHKQILDAIEKHEYDRVATEMAILQSSKDTVEHFFKQAKRALAISLETLMEETLNLAIILGNHIKIEQITLIVENLKRLQRANLFVSEYIDSKDAIENTVNKVKLFIGDRMERILNNIRALVTNNSFNEAEKKIDSMILVAQILGNYCPTTISKEINNLQDYQQKAVTALVKKYCDMDIQSYTLNPPIEIFLKFQEVSNTNPIYHEALSQVRQKIIEKLRKELELAKNQMPPNRDSIYIRRFESAIKHLPDDLKNSLEIDLKHCKDDILSNIDQNNNQLNETLQCNDITSIETILKQYKSSGGMGCYVKQIQDTIRKQIQDLIQIIMNNFDNHQIIDALNSIKKLHEYKMKFNDDINGIQQTFQTVRTRVTMSLQESYLFFTNRFLNNYKSDTTNDAIESVERSFIYLIEYMKFSYDEKDKPILADLFANGLTTQIIEFKKNFLQFLLEQEKQNHDALKNLDVALLEDSLNALKRWDSVIIKIKTYDNIYKINDSSVAILANAIKQMITHNQLLKLISDRLDSIQREIIEQDLINEHTQEYEKQRNEFYRKLNDKLIFIQKVQLIVNRNNVSEECIKSLKNKIEDISRLAHDTIEKILSNSMFMEQDSTKFNNYYNNLLSFKQEIKIKSIDIHKEVESVQNKVSLQIAYWMQLIENESNIGNIAKYLICMQRTSHNLPVFSKQIKEQIHRTLQHCKSRKPSPINLGKLGNILQQDEIGIGPSIIAEHKAFENVSISLFIEKTRKHGIDYVLEKIDGDSIDTTRLRSRYENFQSNYQNLIDRHLKTDMKLDTLISDTKFITGSLKLDPDTLTWDANVRTNIPIITAHVFALWTLQNADDYYESDSIDKQDTCLRQPHAAQIISIFRMLGIGDKKELLENNLVQIGTGEGKSITLGATAAILALLGFDVHCACYSEYLSERDYRAFLPLFNALGLVEYIHYGTFNKLCESMINENGNIRDKVEQFISKDSNAIGVQKEPIKRPKILLIDEVDVFFSRDFYGNVYTPSACLKDPTITALINLIWQQRKSKLTLKTIENTSEYQACSNRFANWKLLITEAVKDLLFDVQNFESHDYVVKQDRIGYIEQDNVVYNVTYGYKTLFAYYCEHDKGTISQASLDENIGITIKCGSFSYAEMPLKFAYIMGVTGTLKTLSEPEKQVIRNYYNIKKNTFTPSVFGDNRLRFVEKDDIKLENEANYFNQTAQEITHQLLGRQTEKRAVIVVLESIQKLKEFYQSKALESIKSSVSCLTEEASPQEKSHLVQRATISGQITLITRTFGRGTDFVCYDQRVAASGGVHVIQTFLSEEVSEEVQIKGRTARQADPGSYSLILNYHDLERFDIKVEDIESIKKGKSVLVRLKDKALGNKTYDTVYEYLNDKRVHLFKTQYEDNMKYVNQAKKRHESTQEFLVHLNSGNINSVRTFLVEQNKGAEIEMNSRTICLMDATGSMTHLLHKCKHKVDDMVQRASQILIDNGYNPNTFQIQFAVYRNYNSKEEKILQASPWETKADNLRTFMNIIEVEGGMGNEAIEIGLLHANRENEKESITQVILIGDAPPNTQVEVTKKREKFGENYWTNTKFAQATDYEIELAKLISNNIPIHAFFVDQRAEQTFRTIADATKGRCEFLDINAASGSETLTHFITEEILRSIGGDKKGNDLVKAYQEKFGKSYS